MEKKTGAGDHVNVFSFLVNSSRAGSLVSSSSLGLGLGPGSSLHACAAQGASQRDWVTSTTTFSGSAPSSESEGGASCALASVRALKPAPNSCLWSLHPAHLCPGPISEARPTRAQSEPRARARAYDSAGQPRREEAPPSRSAPAGLRSSGFAHGAENPGTRARSVSHGGPR